MEELLPSQSVVTADKDGLYPSWRCIPEEGILKNGDDLNEKKQGVWNFNIGASTAISNRPTTGNDMGVLESRYIYRLFPGTTLQAYAVQLWFSQTNSAIYIRFLAVTWSNWIKIG